MQREFIVFAGFDIGEKNFTIFIDRYVGNRLENLKSQVISYSERYDNNGECNPKFSDFLNKLSSCGERIFTSKFDMTSPDDKRHGKRRIITNKLLARLSNYLDGLNSQGIFDDVDYFIIEEQLKQAENNRQIQFHLRSYLIGLFLDFRPIILFPSSYKTRILGAPKKIYNNKKNKMVKLTHNDRKKWAISKAQEIFINRKDNDSIDLLFTKKIYGKGDDCSDCLIQILSFVNIVFMDNKKDLLNF